MQTTQANDVTIAQQAAILAVDEMAVPVVSRDRSMPRKELAAAVRKLFRQLGIKGVSVTTPMYSMAKGVDIRLPRRDDVKGVDGYYDGEAEGAKENRRVGLKVAEILARAFPQHDDRSEANGNLDLYDYKFSINL